MGDWALRSRFISWPNHERRAQLKAKFEEEGFPGCIGIVDGSLIRLENKPREFPDAYYSRKKYYAVNFFHSW